MKFLRSRGSVLLCLGIGFVLGGVLVLVQQAEYWSVATMDAGSAPGEPYDPEFYVKQFAVVRSDIILTNVIAKLGLNDVWGEKYNRGQRMSDTEAEKLLQRQLRLDYVNNTHFLLIGAYHHDPQEVVVLANAVAEAYSDYRTEELRRLVAADPHPHEQWGRVGAAVMDRAVAGLRPVRPNPHLAGLMMVVGTLLVIAGIVRRNSSRIANYFAEMYRVSS